MTVGIPLHILQSVSFFKQHVTVQKDGLFRGCFLYGFWWLEEKKMMPPPEGRSKHAVVEPLLGIDLLQA